MDTDIAVEN